MPEADVKLMLAMVGSAVCLAAYQAAAAKWLRQADRALERELSARNVSQR